MKNIGIITTEVIRKIASLARLSISEENLKKLQRELEASFKYINKIQTINTSNVEETSQVTGLENVLREDKINEKSMLTQEEALSNTPNLYKGYFKISAIFD